MDYFGKIAHRSALGITPLTIGRAVLVPPTDGASRKRLRAMDGVLEDSAERHEGAKRLGLGTAQFGVDYGITNLSGQVSWDEAHAIIATAADSGIGLIDTAALYGESEKVIGASACAQGFKIVTKTERVGNLASPVAAADAIERSLHRSLENLRTTKVGALLVHDTADILGPFGDAIWRRMEELRRSGQVRNIGVSIYEGSQIDRILDRYDPDIVQVPVNAVDSRLEESGHIAAMAGRGIEIHARSIFLQGLLLQPPDAIPPKFRTLRDAVAGLRRCFAQAGLNVMQGLISSVLSQPAIAFAIVGTTSRRELLEITAAAEKAISVPDEILRPWRITDPCVLNPAMWSALENG